ncbi:MAG TPA: PqiC family protein [Dissulfurispiraceae bacterium]|nr:PqiC family protein [Dissulfurispiraceae bacterium]
MRHRLSFLMMVYLVCLMVLAGGCGSTKPSSFYSLAPMGAAEMPERRSTEGISTVVAVGPVNIPDYLERPQIVTRTGSNEIHIQEFDRWGGSLKDSVARVLAQNLSAMLPPERFTAIPWKPVFGMRVPVTYRVGLVIQEFEGTLGGKVILKALWAVSREEDSSVILVRESSYTEDIGENDYSSLVEAMSKALGRLSSDIAAVLKTLPQQKAVSGGG